MVKAPAWGNNPTPEDDTMDIEVDEPEVGGEDMTDTEFKRKSIRHPPGQRRRTSQ